MDGLTAAVIILAVLVLLLFAAGAGLFRRVRELELATYNGIGLNFATGQGDQQLANVASVGTTTLIVKVTHRCAVCEEILATVAQEARSLPPRVSISVVSDDPAFAWDMPTTVRVFTDPSLFRSLTTPYTPALLVVDEHGMVIFTTPAGSGVVVTNTLQRLASRKEVKS